MWEGVFVKKPKNQRDIYRKRGYSRTHKVKNDEPLYLKREEKEVSI